MSTYIEALKRQVAEIREQREERLAIRSRTLDEKILDWYTALPPQQRRTHYTMSDFVLLFNAAPGRIGTALHHLGWRRGRRWRDGGSYARFWIPAQ